MEDLVRPGDQRDHVLAFALENDSCVKHACIGYDSRMIGVLLAVVIAVVAFWICTAVHMPVILAGLIAILAFIALLPQTGIVRRF